MQYLVSFLEGIITFISPCLLPMLPIYISYFAATDQSEKETLKGALGFVVGFTIVFTSMGALAGSVGGLLVRYRTALDLICGAVIAFFGLNYLGVFNINIFNGGIKVNKNKKGGFFPSALLGIVFSVGWSPCVGIFLSSALILASQQATMIKGILMLLSYSLGLGIPFVISAILIDRLKSTFEYIRKNYRTINTISGIILLIIGIMVATGGMGRLLNILG